MGTPPYPQKGVAYIIMLKVTSIVKSKAEKAWAEQHIVNVCYAEIDEEESDELSALHAESFSQSSKYKDGAELESLAKGLKMSAKDENGNEKKVSCFVPNDWTKTLENVNNVLVGVVDKNAYGTHVPASVIMNDETVVCLVSKSEMEIPSVPVMYRVRKGQSEEDALKVATERLRARWQMRINKGTAKVKRKTTTAE